MNYIEIVIEIIKFCIHDISSLGMLVIAVIVAYIAFMQFKTNRDRLRLELYDKRFSVYEALKEFLIKFIRALDVTDKDLRDYRNKTNEAEFLFEEDIILYIKDIYDKGLKIYSYNCKQKSSALKELDLNERKELKDLSI